MPQPTRPSLNGARARGPGCAARLAGVSGGPLAVRRVVTNEPNAPAADVWTKPRSAPMVWLRHTGCSRRSDVADAASDQGTPGLPALCDGRILELSSGLRAIRREISDRAPWPDHDRGDAAIELDRPPH